MRRRFQLGAFALSCGLAGCQHSGVSGQTAAPAPSGSGARPIAVVAVENVYADMAAQIGGDAVAVVALQQGVDADPHAYEPTISDAEAVSGADIVIRNGLGYDAFVQKLLDASPRDGRALIDAGALMHRANGSDPHLWYDIETDRTVASTLAAEFERRAPRQRAAIEERERGFVRGLDLWDAAMRDLKSRAAGAKVATTEPVFDFVLSRAGILDVTPHSFALAIEEGNDPAPQDVATLDALVPGGVRALIVNAQTVEPATTRLVARATAARLPVVSVTEALPNGTHAQTWLLDETEDLARVLTASRAS